MVPLKRIRGKRQLRVFLALFAALILIRIQLVFDLGFSWKQAIAAGMAMGFISDAAVCFLPIAVSHFLGSAFTRAIFPLGVLVSLVLWFSSVANFLYFKFFNTPLEWWVVRHHWNDSASVSDSGLSLFLVPGLVASLILLLAGMRRWFKDFRNVDSGVGARAKYFFIGGLSLSLLLLIKQSPVWLRMTDLGPQHRGSIVTIEPLFRWVEDFSSPEGKTLAGSARFPQSREESRAQVAQALLRYRDYQTTLNEPLFRSLGVSQVEGIKLRERFGFVSQNGRPLSVILLFVESLRTFELLHPDLGREIFPHLRSVIDQHAVLFSQAYSSSVNAGQTVRGQFSTLCSMLPDPAGPATYLAYPTVHITCLPELLNRAGYQTGWFHSGVSTFHNKGTFESLHGTKLFYDQQYFKGKGVRRTIGRWGLDDKPFLKETLAELERLDQNGPFFANVLTINTHHPYSPTNEGVLSPRVLARTKASSEYQAFLSLFASVDRALGAFFEEFFESPLADHTVVVLLSDHSVPIQPPFALAPHQAIELRHRIPVAFISKNLKKPEVIHYPIHQVDVAPALLRILGVQGRAAWLGRDPFSGSGSPWLSKEGAGLFYRAGMRSCYAGDGRMNCFSLKKDVDPLFASSLDPAPEIELETKFFQELLHANGEAIAYDLLESRL